MTRRRITPDYRQQARSLRQAMTKGEVLLWLELRGLKEESLRFRRPAPIGPYLVDFARLGSKLVPELDGDLHESAGGKRNDRNGDAFLRPLGHLTMRVDCDEVLGTGSAWNVAQMEVASGRQDPTRPLRGHPPIKGEGSR